MHCVCKQKYKTGEYEGVEVRLVSIFLQKGCMLPSTRGRHMKREAVGDVFVQLVVYRRM